MKKILLFLILNSQFLILSSFAQSPDWLWAKRIGGAEFNHDIGTSIVTDASGNLYATGFFAGTVDFNPGTGVFNLTSAGQNDIFISKFDASGNFAWAKAIGGTNFDYGFSIAIDFAGTGDIYFTGSFSGTVDFDPGISIDTLISSGSDDIFICRFDSSGNFIWAKGMGSIFEDVSRSIALDPSGSGAVYTTGYFYTTVDFDPGPGVFNLTSSGFDDIFISKLDSSGNFVWAKAMGGPSNDDGFSITIDPTGNWDVYVTGGFAWTVDFDPGPGVFNLTSAGMIDIFVSKLDSAGNFVWAKRMGSGTNNDIGFSIAIDPAGNDVYTTGLFQGTVDFDPGTGVFNLTSNGDIDIFISKLNNSGNFVWAKRIGGTDFDRGSTVAVGPDGGIFTTGLFSGTVDFDPGVGSFNLSAVGNSFDIFISKLDSSGNFGWAKKAGGANNDAANSMVFDASGHLLLTGYFNSPTITFGPTTLNNALGTGVYSDLFIVKLDSTTITGINDVPASHNMTSIFPNPFSNSTTISFSLSQTEKVSLKIFDVNGRLIKTLADNVFETGEYQIEFNAEKINAGIYFLKMQAGEFLKTEKLIVTK